MSIDVMLDLETLATDQGAIVTSIGAVKMDMDTLDIQEHSKFVMNLYWQDQFKRGRTCDPGTVRWWLGRSDEARRAILEKPLLDNNDRVLQAFKFYMIDVNGLWGNGADFDCGILRSLFETYELETPWKHWQHRCFRTMKNLHREVEEPDRGGTHHNAYDDALHQARWLMRILAS